jgi:hypothetical protein
LAAVIADAGLSLAGNFALVGLRDDLIHYGDRPCYIIWSCLRLSTRNR